MSNKLNLPLEELAKYDILTEVPLETTNGFMKADIVFILKNEDGIIQDVIVIENKLSSTIAFTKRQKEGFGSILNGQNEMKVKYNVNGLRVDEGPITVSSENIFKISDAGTDDINNVTIEKIIKVN